MKLVPAVMPDFQTILGLAHGVPFRLEVADKRLRSKAQACVPHDTAFPSSIDGQSAIFSLELAPESGVFSFLQDRELLLQSRQEDAVLERLTQDLMIHVANHAPERVFLHAGVVAYKGRGLLLPGQSFAGKTTLVAELIRAGATYYSDEYAVIDFEGVVHPCARDLQVRRPGETKQRSVPASELTTLQQGPPLRISHILFAEYVPGATWAPQPVSPGLTVLEMLQHTIPVQRTPRESCPHLTPSLRAHAPGDQSATTSARSSSNCSAPWSMDRSYSNRKRPTPTRSCPAAST